MCVSWPAAGLQPLRQATAAVSNFTGLRQFAVGCNTGQVIAWALCHKEVMKADRLVSREPYLWNNVLKLDCSITRKLNTHLHVMPRLRMRGFVPPRLPTGLWHSACITDMNNLAFVTYVFVSIGPRFLGTSPMQVPRGQGQCLFMYHCDFDFLLKVKA